MAGIYTKYILETLKKSGRTDIKTDINWDKTLTSLVKNVLRRGKVDPSEENIHDVLAEAVTRAITPKFIEEYETGHGTTFEQYILRRTQQRAIDKVKSLGAYEHRKKAPPSTTEETQEEWMERTGPSSDPQEALDFKSLLRDVTKFLAREPNANRLIPVLSMAIEGHDSTEIAESMSVSPAAINGYFKSIGKFLLEYADLKDNHDLNDLVGKYLGGRRRASDDTKSPTYQDLLNASARARTAEEDEAKKIFKVFEEYKKKHASLHTAQSQGFGQPWHDTHDDMMAEEHEAATYQITQKAIKDLRQPDNYATFELDPFTAEEDRQNQHREFIESLEDFDEIIDDDDLMIGLKLNLKQTPEHGDGTTPRGPEQIRQPDVPLPNHDPGNRR